MTKSKVAANATTTGSQRKRTPNQRANVASQTNNTTAATATTTGSNNNNNNNSVSQQTIRKNKQNTVPNPNPNPSHSQSQSQASTKPSSPVPPSKTKTPPPPKVEEYVPLKGFNAAEVDSLLSTGYDPTAMVYKSEQPAVPKPAPWAQKPGTMATGKDFWIELRKQLAILQKGESTNKGG